MDIKDIERLEALEAKATAGPWVGDRIDGTVKYVMRNDEKYLVLQVDHKNGEYGFLGEKGEHDEKLVMEIRNNAKELLALAKKAKRYEEALQVAAKHDPLREWMEDGDTSPRHCGFVALKAKEALEVPNA